MGKVSKQQERTVLMLLTSAMEMLDISLPHNLTYEEYREDKKHLGYVEGVLDVTGLNLAKIYNEVTGAGLGAGDALEAAGDFNLAVSHLFTHAWSHKGDCVRRWEKKLIAEGKSPTSEELYNAMNIGYPDAEAHAEAFVKYLALK